MAVLLLLTRAGDAPVRLANSHCLAAKWELHASRLQ